DELTARGRQGLLAVDVAQPCGQFPESLPHGVPVLPDEGDPVVVVEGDHRDGVVVTADLPVGGAPARHGQGVHTQPHDATVEDLTARDGPVVVSPGGTALGHAGQLPSARVSEAVSVSTSSARTLDVLASGASTVSG